MPAPLPDGKRAAILADIRAGMDSCRSIAAKHGVSAASVANIAKANGLHDAFERTQTKRATEAKVADNKALRAKVARKFLDKANAILDQVDEPHLVFSFGGRDNTYNEHVLERPPAADLRNLMTSAAIAFDKHMAADRHDSDDHGLPAVDSWLRDMLGGTNA